MQNSAEDVASIAALGLFKRGEAMSPELAAFLQQQMWLTDDEISAIAKDPSALEALLDMVFETP